MSSVYDRAIAAPWVDEKYVMILSHSMDRFTVTSRSPLAVNFRCPICGDSQKSKRKARGYMFRTPEGTFWFKCHNCAASKSLRAFLKQVDYNLYREYVSELYLKPRVVEPIKDQHTRSRGLEPVDVVKRELGIPKLSDLPESHPAVKYWLDRKLPVERMADAYWTDAYFHWVNAELIPGKFNASGLSRDCGRIVLPFRTKEKNICAVSGRSIGNEEPKYVAVKLHDAVTAFGLERVDESRTVFVLEGPFDSMFVDNAVAMGTSNKHLDFPKKVMVYDNEPRAQPIITIMTRAIEAGETIVVWPPDVPEKDVNAMVLAGRDPVAMIRERMFSGLRAKIELNNWRRV